MVSSPVVVYSQSGGDMSCVVVHPFSSRERKGERRRCSQPRSAPEPSHIARRPVFINKCDTIGMNRDPSLRSG